MTLLFRLLPTLLITLQILLLPQCHAQAPQFVTVRTSLGDVRGRVSLVLNRNVNQFLGVPYAEPPLGELRFRKPVPVRAWRNGVLDATQFGSACPQPIRRARRVGLGEDCLFLNIYVLSNSSSGSEPPQRQRGLGLAVMVWIHGGGFVVGAGSDVDGSAMAARGQVVVVTVNYRLGLLGWLSTLDDASPGNNGLWDQRLALLWVRQHIAAFGGDPNQVTIFGESGGGYSVGLHTLSPLNNGLFQRAVMQSGSALNRRTITLDPVGFAQRFARNLGCWRPASNGATRGFDTQFLVTCARQRTVADIIEATELATVRSTVAWILDVAPVIDGELIPNSIETLLGPQFRDHVPFWRVDIMVGTTSAEGSLVLSPLRPFQGVLRFNLANGIPTRVLQENITTALTRDYFRGSRNISNALLSEYRTQLGDAEQGRQVVNLYGDMMFYSAAVETLQRHTRAVGGQRSQYQYQFSYTRPGRTPYSWFRGAGHAAEIGFLFGMSAVNYEEARMSIAMIDGWTNFAKFGTPNNPGGQPGAFQWPAYDLTNRAYTNLDLVLTSGRDLYSQRMQFWLQTIPRLTNGVDPFASLSRVGQNTFTPILGSVEEELEQQQTPATDITKPPLSWWFFGKGPSNGGASLKMMAACSAFRFAFYLSLFVAGVSLM